LDLNVTVYYDELVARCQRGDSQGFEALYAQYARAMFNTSLRIVNNRADAEDVLQDAFTAAFRYLGDFDHSSSFGAWIKRIVVNKSVDVLRRRKLVIVEMDDLATQRTDETDVLDEDELQLRVEEVKKAVSQLPNGYRTVITLHLFEGYDHDEIAGILGISAVTVRTQYHRARQKLQNLLRKEVRHD
jgi:RNA polymerase sigma factor (sigma-70 family)